MDGKILLYEFIKEHSIGEFIFSENGFNIYFSHNDFEYLNKLGLIFDAFNGGIILGNLHSNGGINMIIFDFELNKYKYIAEMEGWEYLTFPLKNQEIENRFLKINEKTQNINPDISTEFKIPKECNVIDTQNNKVCFLLMSEYRQCIINRFATKKHINEILQLEKTNNS
ncbi:hypothetical protein ACFO3U_09940 [Flavobacterium ponti]|uniref:SMI1/KNR4 family protein n=1 Tax=Flavobacterium ponti TaxID=665133 RepID=A0ABV9P432_9FLAO